MKVSSANTIYNALLSSKQHLEECLESCCHEELRQEIDNTLEEVYAAILIIDELRRKK